MIDIHFIYDNGNVSAVQHFYTKEFFLLYCLKIVIDFLNQIHFKVKLLEIPTNLYVMLNMHYKNKKEKSRN